MNTPTPLPGIHPTVPLERVISGGQTGVDRAALDAAIAAGIDHGGWCPKGRISEEGPIPCIYRLEELPTMDYSERTRQNVIASDGTLILGPPRLSGGSLLTLRIARELKKPCLAIKMPEMVSGAASSSSNPLPTNGVSGPSNRAPGPANRARDLHAVKRWLSLHSIRVLNVAGPRASKVPDAYEVASALLKELFQTLERGERAPWSQRK
ncbi:putative molybdenum carrier protein [Pirellulaceae bacterium SH467]